MCQVTCVLLIIYVPYIAYNSEVIIVCGAMIGAGLGFLWFNAHPAQVFMGDVGALALGAMLGTIAVMTRQEIAFAIMGGLFVAEALSVMLQVGSYKLRKNVSFVWRRYIIILKKLAGKKPKWWHDFGSSPSYWLFLA